MTLKIQYIKQFKKENNEFLIILSKLSELKNIKNLPFDVFFLSNSKEIEKTLDKNEYYESFIKSIYTRSLVNIKIILIVLNPVLVFFPPW